jgi:uncharacterized membrane protein
VQVTSTPSPDASFSPAPAATVPPIVTWTERLEAATALDPVVRAVRPLADALVSDPARRDLLRGAWLGHAVHPLLTDLPIGLWTSALTLDLVGGASARPAARRLVGLGVLLFVPTALTGWAEWSGIETRDQRVGVVHAVANAAAALGFAASWRARRRGRVLRGKALGLGSASLLGVGGYLGGHLVSTRKISSHNPAFDA